MRVTPDPINHAVIRLLVRPIQDYGDSISNN